MVGYTHEMELEGVWWEVLPCTLNEPSTPPVSWTRTASDLYFDGPPTDVCVLGVH